MSQYMEDVFYSNYFSYFLGVSISLMTLFMASVLIYILVDQYHLGRIQYACFVITDRFNHGHCVNMYKDDHLEINTYRKVVDYRTLNYTIITDVETDKVVLDIENCTTDSPLPLSHIDVNVYQKGPWEKYLLNELYLKNQ